MGLSVLGQPDGCVVREEGTANSRPRVRRRQGICRRDRQKAAVADGVWKGELRRGGRWVVGAMGLTSSLVFIISVSGSHCGFQQGRTRFYLQLSVIIDQCAERKAWGAQVEMGRPVERLVQSSGWRRWWLGPGRRASCHHSPGALRAPRSLFPPFSTSSFSILKSCFAKDGGLTTCAPNLGLLCFSQVLYPVCSMFKVLEHYNRVF